MIARIESRQYLREESFQVNEVLREIIGELNPIAEDTGILLSGEFERDMQLERANRSLIFSMFYNVVNNAVKNTSSGGEVHVKSSVLNGRFMVIISDSGRGMTDSQVSTLFSRFSTRLETSGNNTGIGLAISKSIADFHNIEISVRSVIEKGTTFYIPVS